MTGGSSKAGVKTNDRLCVKHEKGRKLKDPNRPKRPPGPFLVFMEGFRMEFKQKNPTVKGGAAMGKAGGDKWRSMSNDDKAKFVAIAEQRKKDYEKKMKAYETKLARGKEVEESDKSKSKVNSEEDNEESEKVESFDGSRKRIRRSNSDGKKGSSDSECGDSGEKDEGFVQENDRVGGDLDEEGKVRKMRALFQKIIVDVEGQDIDKMGGSVDQDIPDETEGDPLSVMCECQNNEEGQVVICGNCKLKQYSVPCMTRCVPTLHSEDSFHSSKLCNSSSKVAGQSLESDPNSVPSTNDKVVKDCRQGSSAVEDVPSEKGGKELHTSDDTTTSKIDSIKQFVEVVPIATSLDQPVYTPSTLHDSPNISHQTPSSIPTETVGFFKQLEDMLQGNKSDWVLPPQIQLDEQTICDYEQLLKMGLSGDLKDLFKDSTYGEFNEALTGLLACRRIPSNLHQGFLTLRRDLPSLASRVSELNKEITQGMLHKVNRSTMKELESCLHKYRKYEEHLLKLEQEKEYNVSEINRLKARNQVIDSEIATYTAETDALQKASAPQTLKIANLDAAGALNESTLQRSLDDLNNMENEWRKRVNMLDF